MTHKHTHTRLCMNTHFHLPLSLSMTHTRTFTHTHILYEHTLSPALFDVVTVEVKRPRATGCSESQRLIGCANDPFDQSGLRFKGSEVDDEGDRRLPIGGSRLRRMEMSTQMIFLTFFLCFVVFY